MMGRVVLALFVCLLAVSFTDAVDRKAMQSLRLRMQRAGATVTGRDDMEEAERLFTPIRDRIRTGMDQVEGDSVAERRFYTTFAANLIPTLERELRINLQDLDSPNLSDADLERAAKVAYLARHELRLRTRDHQSRRSCASFMRWVAEARDYVTYKSKDGPTYPYLFDKAAKELGIKPPTVGVTPRAIATRILRSSTTTNTAVNKALGIEVNRVASPSDANDAPLLIMPSTPTAETLKTSTPPPAEFKVEATCSKSDRVLANLYSKDLALPLDKAVNMYDEEQNKQDDSVPSASPSAVGPTGPKKTGAV